METTNIKIKHPPLSIHLGLCLSPLTWHHVTPDFPRRSRKLPRGGTRKMVVVSWWKRSDFKTRDRTVGASMWFPYANKWAWLTWHLADGGARKASAGHQIPALSKPSKPTVKLAPSTPSQQQQQMCFIDHRCISALHYTLWVTVKPKSENSICGVVLPDFLQLRVLSVPREYKTGRWLCFFTRVCKEIEQREWTAAESSYWLCVHSSVLEKKKDRKKWMLREMFAAQVVCFAGGRAGEARSCDDVLCSTFEPLCLLRKSRLIISSLHIWQYKNNANVPAGIIKHLWMDAWDGSINWVSLSGKTEAMLYYQLYHSELIVIDVSLKYTSGWHLCKFHTDFAHTSLYNAR